MVANILVDFTQFCSYFLFIPKVKGPPKSYWLPVASLEHNGLFQTYILVINLNLPLKKSNVFQECFIVCTLLAFGVYRNSYNPFF